MRDTARYDELLDAGETGVRCPVCRGPTGYAGEPCSDACARECAHTEYLRDAGDDWARDAARDAECGEDDDICFADDVEE